MPPDYQSNNNNINKNYISNITNSQGINASNIPKQELKDSNNINNNNSDNESGEIELKNLKHEEDFDMNEKNDNNFNNLNGQNNLENDKDKEIDEITEELYIEEYNPSLGLSKIDNPKYMNAVIQCFSHIPDITDKIINLHCDSNFKDNLSNLKLTKRYRNLLINTFFPEKVYNMNKEAYNPNLLRNTLYELNPLFQNNENIELKEFINYLILKLHDELNTKKNSSANQSSNDNINKNMENKNENDALVDFLQNFTTKNNSIISKTLYGISKYTFYCHQCQKSFFNFQCYSYLYFNLNDIIEYKQNKYRKDDVEINLNDCFDYYQRSETLRGDKGLYCPSCLEQTESTSIKNIYSTKNVLIIILDRKSGNNFNECKFDLKEVTNLRDYVQYKKEGEKTREKFFLGGVVNYIGDNYGNETYSAFIKMGKNNEWYCYDDENVYPTSFQDITNNGYPIILFYHK
jgi:ubiquitin C-terminal hydrolase